MDHWIRISSAGYLVRGSSASAGVGVVTAGTGLSHGRRGETAALPHNIARAFFV
jgi:hypothetical protein